MKKNNTVRCPYCGYVFIPEESDIQMIDKIESYWCKNEKCQENFIEELKINTYKTNTRRDWE